MYMYVTTALLYATIVVGARSETELLEWIVENSHHTPHCTPVPVVVARNEPTPLTCARFP
jgi:hypothetical protein